MVKDDTHALTLPHRRPNSDINKSKTNKFTYTSFDWQIDKYPDSTQKNFRHIRQLDPW